MTPQSSDIHIDKVEIQPQQTKVSFKNKIRYIDGSNETIVCDQVPMSKGDGLIQFACAERVIIINASQIRRCETEVLKEVEGPKIIL